MDSSPRCLSVCHTSEKALNVLGVLFTFLIFWGACSTPGYALSPDEVATPLAEPPKGDEQAVYFEVAHDFKPTGKLTALRVWLGIPKTVQGYQQVMNIQFTPNPCAVYDDTDTRYAIFQFANLSENQSIKMKGEIKLFRKDLETAMANWNPTSQPNFTELSDSERSEFLKSEKFLEVNDPVIRRIAATMEGPRERLEKMAPPNAIQASQSAEIETVQEILEWLRRNIKWDNELKPQGAVATAQQGRGVCQQFSELFITLCRSKGLPARYVGGLVTWFDRRNPNSTPRHAWAEVFLSGLGWVPFDPTWMASTSDVVKPNYISLTKIRNHLPLNIGNHIAWRYGSESSAKVSVFNSYTFKALSP